MANILNNYIKILLMIIFFFSDSKEDIIENPKLIISNFQNPIIFNGNNKYYYIYNSPYFLCVDESDNYFLYANKIYYNIKLNSFFEIININEETTTNFNSRTEYIGCFKHYQHNSQNVYDRIGNNEIIFYGEQTNTLYFLYIKKNFENDASKVKDFNNKISCKLIENINYICSHIDKNNNKIIISYVYLTQLNGNSDIAGTTHNNIINNDNSDYVILFNTNINIH